MAPLSPRSPAIRVRFFARYAELFGTEHIDLPVEGINTVGDVLERLRGFPGGAGLGSAALVAVNLRQAKQSTAVSPQDEIAILPPLAGG